MLNKLLYLTTLFVIITSASYAQSQYNLESDGDCQFKYQSDGYGIYSITFPIKHTGLISNVSINKVRFRLTISDAKTQEVVYSKIFQREILLNPGDVDYITLILNKNMTKNYDCDYCLEYVVEYLPTL